MKVGSLKNERVEKEFCKDLKLVYTAPNVDCALLELDNLESKWGDKYDSLMTSWRDGWEELPKLLSILEE